jgi:hypothetical protein
MAYLRLSRAKYQYECDRCSRIINKGRDYYRLEPFPIARIKGIEKVKHLCLTCVQGEQEEEVRKETQGWLRNYWTRDTQVQSEQLPFLSDEPIVLVKTQVHIVNITSDILKGLGTNPDEIYKLTPEAFEELICDRLQAMGYGVTQVGGHSYHKDGGIDIFAWPKKSEFPFLMAIQAKHHRSPEYKTGPGPVRELLGVVRNQPVNVGVLVTNTTFTPDAKWVAEQQSFLVRLRDIQDIRRWLENNFLDEYEWREIPEQIAVCPGVVIHLPKV